MTNEDYASAAAMDGYIRPAEIVSAVAKKLRRLSSSKRTRVAARIRSGFNQSIALPDDRREALQRGWEAVVAGVEAEKSMGLYPAYSIALTQRYFASAAEYFRQADARLEKDVYPSSYE
jgi:hypothetical protein